MEENIMAERNCAVANGEVEWVQGVCLPVLRVVADGSYSKQSHKHSYSSMSAVVIVVGYHTNKLLWFGVLNRYCAMCVRGKKPPCTCASEQSARCKTHHRCYKNWNGSAKSMEVELIKQAFASINSAEGLRKYECKVKYLIGDGDSSIMNALRSCWIFVEKIECANHAVKSYRGHIETLLSKHPEWKSIVTALVASRIVSGARCAVKQRNQQMMSTALTRAQASKALEQDLVNGIFHYLGIHNFCSETYCRFQKNSATTKPIVQTLRNGVSFTQTSGMNPPHEVDADAASAAAAADINVDADVDADIDDGNIGTAEAEAGAADVDATAAQHNQHESAEDADEESEEEITLQDVKRRLKFASKSATEALMEDETMLDQLVSTFPNSGTGVEESIENVFSASQPLNAEFALLLARNAASARQLVCEIQALARILANKNLIDNCTTNAAECWFSVKQILDGGKSRNLVQAGGFEQRMQMLGMRVVYEHQWLATMYQNIFVGEPLPSALVKAAKRKQTKQLATKFLQKQPKYKLNRSLSRRGKAKNLDEEMGQYHGDVDLDLGKKDSLTDEELQSKMRMYEKNMYKLDVEELGRLCKHKQGSEAWRAARRIRVTASFAGRVCKTRGTTNRSNLVRSVINPSTRLTQAMKSGVDLESSIIDLYIALKSEEGENVTVRRSGLLVHPTEQWLAGTPDGIVTSSTSGGGLLEVKYLYAMAQRKLTIRKAVDFAKIAANNVKNFCLQLDESGIQLKSPGDKKTAHDFYYQIQMQLQVADKEWCDFVCCSAHFNDIHVPNPENVHIQRVYRDQAFWDKSMYPQLFSFFHEALLPELAAPHGECNLGSVGPRDLDVRRARRSTVSVKREDTDVKAVPAVDKSAASTAPEISEKPARTNSVSKNRERRVRKPQRDVSDDSSSISPKRKKFQHIDDEYISTPDVSHDIVQTGVLTPLKQPEHMSTPDISQDIVRPGTREAKQAVKRQRMFPSSDEDDSNDGESQKGSRLSAESKQVTVHKRRTRAAHVEVVELSSADDDDDDDDDMAETPRATLIRELKQRGITPDKNLSVEQLSAIFVEATHATYESRLRFFEDNSIVYPPEKSTLAPKIFRKRAGLARLWDFLGSGGLSKNLANTLAYFGFNVIGTSSRKKQESSACGYVAARVVATFPRANWLTYDASRSVDKSWVTEGNSKLGLQHGTEAVFLSSSQVAQLVRQWGGTQRYREFKIQSADVFVMELVQNLSKSDRDDEIKIRIVNTEDTPSTGLHWVTIAYTLSS